MITVAVFSVKIVLMVKLLLMQLPQSVFGIRSNAVVLSEQQHIGLTCHFVEDTSRYFQLKKKKK